MPKMKLRGRSSALILLSSLTFLAVVCSQLFRPLSVEARPAGAELIVKVRSMKADSSSARPLWAGASVRRMRGDARYRLVKVDSALEAATVLAGLAADPNVEYVEVNQTARALFTPNDTYFSKQWNLAQVKAQKAWDRAPRAGAGVTVAVLDTGVAYEDYGGFHKMPDFAGTAFVPGFDFVNQDSHPNDDFGHGTHVAGTIAQTTNNGYGAAGLAFGVKLMPIKVLDANGAGDSYDIAEGVRWAADNGAKVVNLSLGLNGPSKTVKEALDYARDVKKVTVVAASGNSAGILDYAGGLMYPAAYDSVISVGATRFDAERAAYSQYGSGLDLVAPGGDTHVDQNGDGIGDGIVQETIQMDDGVKSVDWTKHGMYWMRGTSMAAPHVAAAAAMVIAAGVSEPSDVYQALTRSARDLGAPGYDSEYGFGLLDAEAALKHQTIPTTWYFAEGNTAGNFDTKLLIANAAAQTAKLRVTFTKPGGAKTIKRYNVGPTRRFTVDVDDVPGLSSTGLAIKVESINGVGVTAERAMYFNYAGRTGGHVTVGATAAAPAWFFAQGKTRDGFETHVLVYNPSDSAARFRLTLTKLNGEQVIRDYSLGAWGRRKIVVDKITGAGSAEFAVKVESLNNVGLVAERSVYFKRRGVDGGHNTMGATSPSNRWLFAGGATGPNSNTQIFIQNPSADSAVVRVTFYKLDGSRLAKTYAIAPSRTAKIAVDRLPGLASADFSAKVESRNGVGIVAERSIYFNFNGRSDGSAALGAKRPSTRWYLADGKTGAGFDTYLLVFNPRGRAAQMNIRFMKPDGGVVVNKLRVAAGSMRAVAVDEIAGLSDTEPAALLIVGNGVPVVVERAVSFDYRGWTGASSTMGYRL